MKNYFLKFTIVLEVLFIFGCGGGGDTKSATLVFASSPIVSILENQTYVLTVVVSDIQTVTYVISGGADKDKFTIDELSGKLAFKNAPDFDAHEDNDHNNKYEVVITATDLHDNKKEQNITVEVLNIDDISPVFVSNHIVSVLENQKSSLTVKADDISNVTYSITAGADKDLFDINVSSGVITFKVEPDYEVPIDYNRDNRYEIIVTATDSYNNKSSQYITIEVINLNEQSQPLDRDNDYIPDNIETLLGTDPNDSDSNNNGILDGLDIEGEKGDKFFDMQWYIRSLDIPVNNSGVNPISGNDLRLLSVYHSYMGYNYGKSHLQITKNNQQFKLI